jgi:hypothetical protein
MRHHGAPVRERSGAVRGIVETGWIIARVRLSHWLRIAHRRAMYQKTLPRFAEGFELPDATVRALLVPSAHQIVVGK